MPIDALYNAIRNAPNQQGWQAAQQREAAAYQAAIDEAVAREQAAQQAQQLWNGYDYNAEAERRAQVGGYTPAPEAFRIPTEFAPRTEYDPQEQARRIVAPWQPSGGIEISQNNRAAYIPGTQIEYGTERGDAYLALAAQRDSVDKAAEPFNPFKAMTAAGDATGALKVGAPSAKAYNALNDTSRAIGAEQDRIGEFLNDEEYRADKAATAAAIAAQQRRENLDPTEAAWQLDQLKRQYEETKRVFASTNPDDLIVDTSEKLGRRDEILDNLTAQIAQLEADLTARQNETRYSQIMRLPDFEQNSQYVPRERIETDAIKDPSGEGIYRDRDVLYEAVNGNRTAINQYNRMTGNSGNYDGLAYMTDDERRIYNYLYARDMQSEDSFARDDPETHGESGKYLKEILPTLNARMRADAEKQIKAEAKEHPFAMSAASVFLSPLKAASYASQLGELAATGKIDQNASGSAYSYMNNAVRSAVSREIERNWGKSNTFAYNTAMSMADNLWQMFLTGGPAGEGAMLAIMGTGAAADSVIAAKDRGLTDAQAFALGTATGAIEALTEKIGFDNLYNVALRGDTAALKALLSQTLAEGSEEFAGSILDNLADMIIAGTDSEHYRRVRALVASGMSETEAIRRAWAEDFGEAGMEALSGALSGMLMSGGGRAIMSAFNAAPQVIQNIKDTREQNRVDEMVRMANEEAAQRYANLFKPQQTAQTEQTAAVPSETPANPVVSAPTAPQTVTDTATQTTQETPIQNGESGQTSLLTADNGGTTITESQPSNATQTAPTQTNPKQTAPATNTAQSSQSSEVQASVDADRTTWENWKTERAEGNTAEAKPLSALIEEMRTFFGLHVGVGNVRTPRANATYNTRDHDIRTRIANNVPSISHELGHHIDRLHGITRNASAEVKTDLDAAYSREFADDTYAKSEHASEGLAQFIKYYLTNSEQAVSDFPDLANAFLSSLTEQERSFINSFADEVNAYMSTAVEDRPSSVVLPGEKNDTRSTREKASQAADRFIQNWTDRFHGIKRAEVKLGGDGAVYQTVQGLPYARNVADYCLTKEMTTLNGQRVGGSLVSALEGINVENKAEFRAFGDYLVAKHLPERLAQGKRVYADEQRNSIEAAQKRIAQLDAKYPQFKAAAERVVRYERQLVKTFGVDAGLVSADTFKHWQEIYPNHVPLNRVMDETGGYGAKRGGEVDSAFKMTAKDGSGRDIVHPVMNIINETISLVQLAKENQVRLGLRELAMGQDANAAVMTKVNPMKAETVRADELKDAVRKTARTLAGIVDESNIDRLLDELQDYTIFRKGKGGGNEVPVMVNGKSEMWQINDPLLLDSLNNMRPQKMSAILETYGKISRFITQNITGGDIVWSISRNMPKDQINLLMLMKDKKQLLNVIKNEGVSWANSFLEARGKTDQMNPFVREFYAMGGGRGQSALTQGSDFTRSTARALTGQNKSAKGIAEKILTSPMDLVGFVSDTIETGPRCATYVAYRQNGYSPQRAFYEAMDSTTNFAMQGKLGREVNKVVPFFSAGIAGVNRMVRYLSAEDVAGQGKEARKRAVASRVTTYVVTSFLLTAIQFALNHATKKRKEEYQQVSNYIKNTNWLIPYGDGKFVAIQKSRETNLLSSFFDALLERTVGGDEHAFDEFYGYAVDQVFPGVASDLAKLPENIAKDGFGQGIEDSFFSALGSMGLLGVVANLGANKDFRGRPIVSQTYENLPQREQYNASTSKLAYWIGQAFNISPMKLDYFGKNVLGYMWKYPAQVFPMDPSKRDFSLGVKGTYAKDNVYSNDITNRLYDRADASALAAASYSAGPEQKYYKAKDERMTSFYSRFNKLNRDDSSDTARDDRAEMMDFLAAYLAGAEMGEETKAEQFIREACVENEDTKYLPSALPIVIKDGKNEIQLTASQYFYYQTRYMELYYSKVASRGSLTMNAKRKAEICSAASQEAKEQAAKETLRRR